MSHFTTLLRFICESISGYTSTPEANKMNEVIETARQKIFNFDYPIPEEYKQNLETKINRRYYFREIAVETYALWHFFLQNKMQEIMPYYNQLYESLIYEYEPFDNVNITTTGMDNIEGNKTESNDMSFSNTSTNKIDDKTTTTADNWKYYSDTPQGGVDGLSSHKYLTNATNVDNTNTATGSSTSNGNTNGNTNENKEENKRENKNYSETIKGKNNTKSYSEMIVEYRKSLINIDNEVINELSDLFFMLWE